MEARGTKAALLAHARTTARSLAKRATTPQARADICLDLLADIGDPGLDVFRCALQALPVDERHYWVGTLYTLLLPTKIRRSQATYFTPPTVADAVVDLAIEAGFDIENDTVLDPAAGGAAFLSTLAGRMAIAGLNPKEVAYRLNGIEIDTGLATLSGRLIAERLGSPLHREVIITGDALRVTIPASYGLVIANPPYGRVGLDDVRGRAWRKVAHSGHVNKYALFAELCFRHARPGGIVALVIPSSFRAGPLYDRMRAFIRSQAEVLAVGSIPGRDGVFIDVAQDISVLIARKGKAHAAAAAVSFPVVGAMPSAVAAIRQALPAEPWDAWPLPAIDPTLVGGSTLADYGVTARAGYFVWNREKDRLVAKLRGRQRGYPLIWAKNVRPGTACMPRGKKNAGTDFVTFPDDSAAIVTGTAAVMQRTTNDKQPRRLIAAMVDPSVVSKWGGFVTENHTIVLTGTDTEKLELAVKLLNTAAVDQRYRRVSGTAAVSVTLLRQLDLPPPTAFATALEDADGDTEAAASAAYRHAPETVDA
ncbi:N-6 DNA methylase [Pacificimonas flava]|uniref:site-specific DNA-methyltransferase (adenine-specific) n=1 Tax=Pacificimonas flava TaxID=1234595 RepID=M2T8S7_9SPHN|nr:N-6 DNA methylase [Pacificimonas flava]EMD82894.1 Modification methylase PstI [Pacificimonas flava]MBB5280057.1 adenine-specific DNA-methyltransferase [Pacificimonas flava]